MWGAPVHRRWRGSNLRDPRQAKFLTLASLRWVLRNRAYTPWYLVRYYRLLKFKLANPHIITRGMVFIGKGVEIHATPELAQLEIGRWVHIGDKNTIRAHEGSLRFGDKVVLGRDNVINAYLDIEVGDSVLMADWCYVCDFDHRMDDINVPIKDQGIIKSPVRIGPDTWVGVKCTVLRGTSIGRGAPYPFGCSISITPPSHSTCSPRSRALRTLTYSRTADHFIGRCPSVSRPVNPDPTATTTRFAPAIETSVAIAAALAIG